MLHVSRFPTKEESGFCTFWAQHNKSYHWWDVKASEPSGTYWSQQYHIFKLKPEGGRKRFTTSEWKKTKKKTMCNWLRQLAEALQSRIPEAMPPGRQKHLCAEPSIHFEWISDHTWALPLHHRLQVGGVRRGCDGGSCNQRREQLGRRTIQSQVQNINRRAQRLKVTL